MSAREVRALRNAWLTEVQAIAIYQAEVALLKVTPWTQRRRVTLELCQIILGEECEHQSWIEALDPDLARHPMLTHIYRLTGYLVGVALGFFPYWISWRLHSLAEIQAEAAYLHAEKTVRDAKTQSLLRLAAEQERRHSVRFKEVLRATR